MDLPDFIPDSEINNYDTGSSMPDFIPDDQIDSFLNQRESTPLSGLEATAGGAGKVLNALIFGFGDEATAGVNAAIDSLFRGENYSTAYDERLAQTRDIDKRYSEQNPAASTALGLGGFLTPVPTKIFTAAKGVMPAVKNIATGAGLGAGYGAAYGYGSGEGVDDRISQAEESGAIGALFGGGLQSLAEAGQGVFRGVKGASDSIYSILNPNLDEKAAEVAKQAIAESTDIKTLANSLSKLDDSSDPFSLFKTTAERVEDPGLGLLTKTLENKNNKIGAIKKSIDQARADKRLDIFTEFQGKPRTDEEVGTILQQTLKTRSDDLGKVEGGIYNLLEEAEGTAPIFQAKMRIMDALDKQKASGVPVDKSAMAVIENFTKMPANLTIEQLQGQRQIVGNLLGDLRSMTNADPTQKAGIRLLTELFGGIDEAEKLALMPEYQGTTKNGLKKGFSEEDGALLELARGTAEERGKLFQSGATGKILKKDKFGEFATQPSDVFQKSIASPEDARQVMNALRVKTLEGDPSLAGKEATDALAANLMEYLRDRSTSLNDMTFNARSFVNNWGKIEDVAKEVLSQEQINAIKQVQKDLVGESVFNASVGNSSKGQSATAQRMGAAAFVKDTIAEGIRSKTGLLGRLVNSIGDGRVQKIEGKVDEILTQLAFDPKYARDFLTKPNEETVSKLSKIVTLRLANSIDSATQQPSSSESELSKEDTKLQDTQRTIEPLLRSRAAQQKQASKVEGKSNPSPENTPFSIFSKDKDMPSTKEEIKAVEAIIDKDPYDSTVYEFESGRNPNAKNPTSTALGPFQLLAGTRKSLGVLDGTNIREGYDAFKQLDADNARVIKASTGVDVTADPVMRYSAHYLGATVLRKILNGEKLTEKQANQAAYLKNKLLPRFRKMYEKNYKKIRGTDEVNLV